MCFHTLFSVFLLGLNDAFFIQNQKRGSHFLGSRKLN